MKTHMNTGYSILPKFNKEITMLNYFHTDTESKTKIIYYGPDQYIVKDFKLYELWEVFSADSRSNQTALRISFRVDWISKPWPVWSLADSKIKSGLHNAENEVARWLV